MIAALRRGIGIIQEGVRRFNADDSATHAAAIAYSAVFAIAPLLVVAIGIGAHLLGIVHGPHETSAVENRLVGALADAVGAGAAASIRAMVDASFANHTGSVLAQVIGWVTFFFAASGLFLSLQHALDIIWEAQPKRSGILLSLRNRLVSSIMLLIVILAITATIAIDLGLAFVWRDVVRRLAFPGAAFLLSTFNWLVGVAMLTMLFATVYRVLPNARIAWRDAVRGSIVTASLFVAGEALLGLYLGHAGIANGYGAVGSIVVLLVWVYYSAMLVLFGAELTRVSASETPP